MGVEPTYSAWEADVLPINYIRVCYILTYRFAVFKYLFILSIQAPDTVLIDTISLHSK